MVFFSFFKNMFFRSELPKTVEFIFIGLGNPGEKYAGTRHNIGYRVADALSVMLKNKRCGRKYDAEFVCGELGTKKVLVVKALTFMNNSGVAVEKFVNHYKISLSALLVFVDDFNIPLGTIRIRNGGSHGGHNGLKSITGHIGANYPRLRMGIGPLPANVDIIEFVLGRFEDQNEPVLKEMVERAASASIFYMSNGIDDVMNKYNK